MTEGWRGAGKRPDWDRDPVGRLRADSKHDEAHDRKTGGSQTPPLRQKRMRTRGRLAGRVGCVGVWFDTGPFDRLRAGSPEDSGPAHHERLGTSSEHGRVGDPPLRKTRGRRGMGVARWGKGGERARVPGCAQPGPQGASGVRGRGRLETGPYVRRGCGGLDPGWGRRDDGGMAGGGAGFWGSL